MATVQQIPRQEAREGVGGEKQYKSPRRKLVQFFERSRDRWKAKYGDTKRTVKRLQNKVRFLEERKAHYKERVKELERELARVKARDQSRQGGGEEKKALRADNRVRQRRVVSCGGSPSYLLLGAYNALCVIGVLRSDQFAQCQPQS